MVLSNNSKPTSQAYRVSYLGAFSLGYSLMNFEKKIVKNYSYKSISNFGHQVVPLIEKKIFSTPAEVVSAVGEIALVSVRA